MKKKYYYNSETKIITSNSLYKWLPDHTNDYEDLYVYKYTDYPSYEEKLCGPTSILYKEREINISMKDKFSLIRMSIQYLNVEVFSTAWITDQVSVITNNNLLVINNIKNFNPDFLVKYFVL